MKINVNISPLENEFWPLEGVCFDADDGLLAVVCRINGDEKFRNDVELRFLSDFDVDITKTSSSESLHSFTLTGNVESMNKVFLGFGIAFKKDFETGGRLDVEVEGSCKYYFNIDLV